MPALKAQARFLLRGSALLAGLLVVWWFVLASPMLYVLREAAGTFIGIQENPAGDWTLHVPVEATRTMPGQTAPQQIHSVDFDIPRADAIAFTFSLPLYWAIILAAPGWRRSLRPLLLGTALMCAFELASLLVFCQVTAGSAVAEITGDRTRTASGSAISASIWWRTRCPSSCRSWRPWRSIVECTQAPNKKKRRGSRPAVRIHTKT
jgi:hypothetical protein